MSLLMEGKTSPVQFKENAEAIFQEAKIPQSNSAGSKDDRFQKAQLNISRMKGLKGHGRYPHQLIDASKSNKLIEEATRSMLSKCKDEGSSQS